MYIDTLNTYDARSMPSTFLMSLHIGWLNYTVTLANISPEPWAKLCREAEGQPHRAAWHARRILQIAQRLIVIRGSLLSHHAIPPTSAIGLSFVRSAHNDFPHLYA
ncbi:hypothetical protein AcV5_003398 [Taiwanofungus camphoratus]|nr:hypothetical protein AcV5_003398 [Antrodia cinnamomea]